MVVKSGHTAGDALARELQELCKAKLQPWKYPREVVFRDGLPKNDRGKVKMRFNGKHGIEHEVVITPGFRPWP